MPDTPLNPDALYASINRAAARAFEFMDKEPHGSFATSGEMFEYAYASAIQAVKEELAVAQPEVNSDTELHVGTLIEDHKGRLLWHAWRTGGPGVLWLDDEGRPATPVFPARVLYRPEVKP